MGISQAPLNRRKAGFSRVEANEAAVGGALVMSVSYAPDRERLTNSFRYASGP